MACDYLVIPASSVPAEEANSAAKMTFDDRIKLHSCTFKAEMCIRSWMEVLQESEVRITDNFHMAYEELKYNLDDLVGKGQVIDYMLRDIMGDNVSILIIHSLILFFITSFLLLLFSKMKLLSH